MSLKFEKSAAAAPERASTIGGSTRFVPGQSHDRITVVNGKVQLGQRLKDLWTNRDLLVLLTRTELKVKYKDSALGYAWSMLNPALVLAIYYVIFKIISKTQQPQFAIWLFCGLLVWNLFNNAAMGATGVVVGKAGIIKKVAFPRELLALSTVGVALVLFAIQLVVLVAFLIGFQMVPDWNALYLLPLGFVGLVIFTSAVSIFLSAVNVYLRDTQHLTEVLLMAWFWGTPIVYPYGQIAKSLASHPHLEFFKYIYLANPIAPISMSFQRTIYAKTSYIAPANVNPTHEVTHLLPTIAIGDYAAMLGVVIVVSTGLFLLALIVFGRLEGNFAEACQAVAVAIEINDICKQFRLYNERYTSLKERVIHGGKMPFTPFWALQNVTVDINEGETFGILGRNGCGKSTLLKCIAGILKPTSGEIRVRGSLAAMLELGAGFQQDLSGRDNIFLNGSLLGLSRSEIEKRFDDIVAFAGLEEFIDNQVKFYSSGMYVRLGFAVAVNVEPDVLLVDEVLAVGDAAFQRKCLDHVKRFQREGRTIVVVSHATDVIRQNCERVMVMNHGKVITVDEPGEGIRVFLADLLGVGTLEGSESGGIAGNVFAIGTVTTEHGGSGERPHLYPGEALTVVADIDSLAPVPNAMATIAIHDDTNELVFASDPDDPMCAIDVPEGGGVVRFTFPEVPLLDGTYSVSVGVRSATETAIYDWKDQVTKFEVVNPTRSTGRVRLPLDVSFRLRSMGATGEVPVVSSALGPLPGWEESTG